jgi:hypothetical protein
MKINKRVLWSLLTFALAASVQTSQAMEKGVFDGPAGRQARSAQPIDLPEFTPLDSPQGRLEFRLTPGGIGMGFKRWSFGVDFQEVTSFYKQQIINISYKYKFGGRSGRFVERSWK